MNGASPALPPRVAVVVKLDTLGDLVLFAPVFQALRREWPETRLVAVIRAAYEDLAPHLAPGIEWITTTLDPFTDAPGRSAEFTRLRDAIATLAPGVFIAATSRRNWLEMALSSCSGAGRRLAGGAQTDEFFSTQLRIAFGIEAADAFNETVDVAANEPEWRTNFRLADAALGRAVHRVRPTFVVSDDPDGAASRALAQSGAKPGGYAVCAAAGFANVTLKTWTPAGFAAVIHHLRARHGMRTVLVGNAAERMYLQEIANQSKADAIVWAGPEGTLSDLARVIRDARLYVGNDTGAMHIACALDIPVVAVFGGGTWPRFTPSGRRSASVVQPLPCFGCGWDCAFRDAPCIGGISSETVVAAVDFAVANLDRDYAEVFAIEPLAPATREMMGKAAAQYREARRDHLARQHKLEELTALAREKDTEITQLKAVCDEREQTVIRVDGHARALTARVATLESDYALLQNTLAALPPDPRSAAKALADQAVHVRNIEALLQLRDREIAELKASASNRHAGLHELEQAKHYSRLLAEKEAVIRSLRKACQEREAVITKLTAETTTPTAKARKWWTAISAFGREKLWRPLDAWLFHQVVERYWMQIGVLQHYAARPLAWDDRLPAPRLPDASLPQIAIVTPSFRQERFVERTLRSVLDQQYPKLRYAVQDGGSTDRTVEIVGRYADRLQHWESAKDHGQADAIVRGFRHLTDALAPTDVMAWLNSDDLLGPGVLRYVAEYFARHPEVDVLYGHRIIIDDEDRDVGRWIMPRHDAATLEWIDYVPQETLFWRKRAWDLVGGVDPSFQFALDWDLLARFQQAGSRIVRVPYFLGAFRVHAEQKTSQAIHTIGAEEMRRIRQRFHGEQQDDPESIARHAREARFWGAIVARLHEIGIRW